ncbi:kelch repeat and BTB domain-containing protein 3 isoform X3 [Synchiropus splendidus]|uniref:kelch repeat and BTB domain-containing protein 3 isoform X3 n=1 Tax=Synchiropus splendidus TaxID=270530 RepID=UPI00237E2268|nr:kelch repeat and BTB domain-containing protein 3 isoform X3 [Synchiropus splendidus]
MTEHQLSPTRAQPNTDQVHSSLRGTDQPGCCLNFDGESQRHHLLRASESHGLQLLAVLRSFRDQGLLFDFTIKVQDHSFPCHCCVLAACSDFFRAMFQVDMRERGDGSVTLGNQSPEAVASFLDFAYSGEVLITEGNVDTLFQLASFLQVSVLSKACSDFLIGTLDLSNCLSLLSLAEAYGSESLLESANEFVVHNFHDLSKTKEFLDMQMNVLVTCLKADELNVPDEKTVMMSLLKWIQHDLPNRQRDLSELLSLIRLHHLPMATLETLADSDPLLSQDRSCLVLVSEAQKRQSEHIGLLTDARPSTTQSYIYIQKTEENGEIRHSFSYCLETDRWKQLEIEIGEGGHSIPDPPGSYLSTYAEKVEYYDPLARTWSSVSPLPTAIFYPEASACGHIIYTLGSEVEITDSFNPSIDCFFSYNAQADQWSRLVGEFGQFFHATLVKAVSIHNTLHLCDLSTYKVYSFCPETCSWNGVGSFECAGFNAGAVGVRDRIYILGGDYSPDEITDEVQVYHRGRSQWEEVAPMPRALTEFHCQLIRFNRHRDPWVDCLSQVAHSHEHT